jgi:hypothetical protein
VLLESIVRNHAPIDLVMAVATGEMIYQESAARLAAWTSTST